MSEQLDETAATTEGVRSRVLRAVAASDINRNRKGVRWWTSETEYRLLTAAERKHLNALVTEGLVRFETAGGYPNGWPIGGYHLAPGVVVPPAQAALDTTSSVSRQHYIDAGEYLRVCRGCDTPMSADETSDGRLCNDCARGEVGL